MRATRGRPVPLPDAAPPTSSKPSLTTLSRHHVVAATSPFRQLSVACPNLQVRPAEAVRSLYSLSDNATRTPPSSTSPHLLTPTRADPTTPRTSTPVDCCAGRARRKSAEGPPKKRTRQACLAGSLGPDPSREAHGAPFGDPRAMCCRHRWHPPPCNPVNLVNRCTTRDTVACCRSLGYPGNCVTRAHR